MKVSSLAEIKKELQHLPHSELVAVIAELAKFSRDNKLYLYFLLYGREQPDLFMDMVKEELADGFEEATAKNHYTAKKSAQALRRKLNKYLKFTKDKLIQLELIYFFCQLLRQHGYLFYKNPVIQNLYRLQVGKAERILSQLHEDLQYDYQNKIEELKEHTG